MKNVIRICILSAIMFLGFQTNAYANSDATNYSLASDSNAEECLAEYEEIIDNIVLYQKELNSKDEIVAYISSLAPTTDVMSYSIRVMSFYEATSGSRNNQNGFPGSIFFRIRVENTGNLLDYASKSFSLDIMPEPYVFNSDDFLAEEYMNRYKVALTAVKEKGIKMTDANTPETVKKYISNLAPIEKNENVNYEIMVYSREDGSSGPGQFRPAVAGNSNRKNGIRGYCTFSVIVNNKLCDDDTLEEMYHISLIPTKYVGSSSSGSSGGTSNVQRRSDSKTSGINIKKPSVNEGDWVKESENWKLLLSDGSWASLQWANIQGKWYLFGADGYMKTGWIMVNNEWYYFADDGSMTVGWIQHNGNWYYLNPLGAMLVSAFTPDGFYVGLDGAWTHN